MLRANSFWKHSLNWPRTHKAKPSAISSQHENPRVRKKMKRGNKLNINTWKSFGIEIMMFKFQKLSFPFQDPFRSVGFLYAKKLHESTKKWCTKHLYPHHGVELSKRSDCLGRNAIGKWKKGLARWLSMLGLKGWALNPYGGFSLVHSSWCFDSKISVTLLASDTDRLPTRRLGYSNAFCYYSGTPQFFWIWIEDVYILYRIPVIFFSQFFVRSFASSLFQRSLLGRLLKCPFGKRMDSFSNSGTAPSSAG